MFYLLSFFSGASGLIYEVVWLRELGNVFGNTVYAVALGAAVLILGLGVGAYFLGGWADRRYTRQPDSLLRTYGYLQLTIAGIGFTISVLLPRLNSLSALASYSLNARGWYIPSIASYLALALIAIVLLAPIAFLMGGTLTLLIRHLVRRDLQIETRRIALLWGVNMAGAALAAFLIDFALVPAVGHFGAQVVAVLLTLVVAAGAFLLASRPISTPGLAVVPDAPATAAMPKATRAGRTSGRRSRAEAVVSPPAPPLPLAPPPVGLTSLALGLSGFSAAGIAILWFRHLMLLLGGFRAVFSLLLTAVLFGIGLGSVLASFLIRFRLRSLGPGRGSPQPSAEAARPAQWMIAALGLFVAATLFGLAGADSSSINSRIAAVTSALARIPNGGANLVRTWEELWLNARPILFEIGVPSVLVGCIYPLANAIVQRTENAVGRHAGLLYLSFAGGASCGVLAASFLMLPMLGIQRTATALTIAGGLAMVPLYLAIRADAPADRPLERLALAGLAVVGGLTLGLWLLLPANFMIARATTYEPNERLLTLNEGVAHVVAVTEVPGAGRRLMTDGHRTSATARTNQRYMRALAHIPLLLIDRPDTVLVIGFGVGHTARAATLHPSIRRVEVADSSTEVLAHAGDFKEVNADVLSDRRVAVYVNEGRQHLRMQAPETYDLITLEPPPLTLSGVGALYSREFYALARTRLKPGGYMSQWLPVYQVQPATLLAMIRAFLDVFPQAVLLGGTQEELILLGANNVSGEVDPNRLAARLSQAPLVQADLQRLDLGSVRNIVGTFVASAQTLAEASRSAVPASDDRPVQEYGAGSRLTWIRPEGVPPSLVDLRQAATWCPRCFVDGAPTPVVERLDRYFALLDPLYKRLVPPADGPGSVADPQNRRLIQESPYLRDVLSFYASSHNARGAALAADGKVDDAIVEFRNALRLNPESAETHWNLGRALVARQATDDGVEHLRRSVDLDPKFGPAHYDLASTLLDLHDIDGAIEQFREALRLMPDSAEAHNNLGIALGSKGKFEDAVDQFDQALKLQPDSTEAQHNRTLALEAARSGKSAR